MSATNGGVTLEEVLPRLVGIYEAGRLVPFIGSGMSRPHCVSGDEPIRRPEPTPLAARVGSRRPRLGTLHDHHVEVRRAEALLARRLVLHGVVEALGRLDVGELRHHDSLVGDVALERGLVPAAHEEPAVVLRVRGPASLAYSPYFSGSVTLICAMMYAAMASPPVGLGQSLQRGVESATKQSHRSVVETVARTVAGDGGERPPAQQRVPPDLHEACAVIDRRYSRPGPGAVCRGVDDLLALTTFLTTLTVAAPLAARAFHSDLHVREPGKARSSMSLHVPLLQVCSMSG